MKSILEQLQAAKGAAEEAAEKMVKARLEYDNFEENNPYPAELRWRNASPTAINVKHSRKQQSPQSVRHAIRSSLTANCSEWK